MTSSKKAAKPAAKKPAAKKAAPAKKAPKAKARKPAPVLTDEEKLALEAAKPLSDLEERFCLEYMFDLNATQAYLRAKPGVKVTTASTEGTRLLGKPWISRRVAELRELHNTRLHISAEDVLEDSVRLIKADARDLVRYEVRCCRHCYGHEFRYQRTALEMEDDRSDHEKQQLDAQKKDESHVYEEFDEKGGVGFDGRKVPNAECQNCWGRGVGRTILCDTGGLSPEAAALYAGVKQSKDGWEVKTRNVDAAAERLFKHFGLFEADNDQQNTVTILDKEESEERYARARKAAEESRQKMLARRVQLEAEDKAEREGQR